MIETTPICLSGGAAGADVCFGRWAKEAAHKVCHFTFKGHRSSADPSDIMVLTEDQLLAADTYVEEANRKLRRRFPTRQAFVNNLLRRNYYEVRDASSIYAISHFENDVVAGGTAWAVQMFIDRFGGGECPAYVFDQIEGRWFEKRVSRFMPIEAPPRPQDIYAGVGSRNLLDVGEAAIQALYR